MTEDELDARIRKIVDAAPPLTDQQRVKLAELLRPVRVSQDRYHFPERLTA